MYTYELQEHENISVVVSMCKCVDTTARTAIYMVMYMLCVNLVNRNTSEYECVYVTMYVSSRMKVYVERVKFCTAMIRVRYLYIYTC